MILASLDRPNRYVVQFTSPEKYKLNKIKIPNRFFFRLSNQDHNLKKTILKYSASTKKSECVGMPVLPGQLKSLNRLGKIFQNATIVFFSLELTHQIFLFFFLMLPILLSKFLHNFGNQFYNFFYSDHLEIIEQNLEYAISATALTLPLQQKKNLRKLGSTTSSTRVFYSRNFFAASSQKCS